MLADIAHGHIDFADVCFLVAVVLFVVCAVVTWLQSKAVPTVLASLGLAFTALALLVL